MWLIYIGLVLVYNWICVLQRSKDCCPDGLGWFAMGNDRGESSNGVINDVDRRRTIGLEPCGMDLDVAVPERIWSGFLIR